ncbi:hypothetical protein F511_21786 [Dorcoceras hygrometricum]|uniref:Uncharacterized protein n=1 Tax=Dorcoceras hygrometricum TaxID=472368 RepID=A0A2Z7DEI6_9LAMI|nr:hypothetical protein F511_21786 [Dorcoceras hygrometricum]
MGFVKADMIYNCLDSVKYDNQNYPMLNENGKAGIGFSKPESFKPDWLKNILEKDKAKASPKPSVHNQSWPNSKKGVSKKRTAADVEAAVPKKKRTSKKKSISSISSLELVKVAEEALVVEPLDVEEPRCSSADAVDLIIQQVLDETRAANAPADIAEPAVTVEKHWFDLPYEDIVKQWEAERPVVTASDTEDEEIATEDVAPADEVQQVQVFEATISAVDTVSADELTSLDDILLSIPVDIPLPSTCMEVTQIKMGQMIKIPGVTKWTWFLKHLPRIPADDKGKEILVEKDPIQGNPAKEHFSLICADIDLLVSLQAKVIDEVAKFLHSFSLKKLATINIEEMYKKEDQVLSWGETESPQEAIQRQFYILLKYRTVLVFKFLEAWRANFAPGQGSTAVDIQVIELLSALHLSLLEELAKEARMLGLTWTKPCCSSVFEGSPRDRGAVIARNNSNTRSLCWIRRMLMVDGAWAVEQCADMWVKIPRKVVSTEVPLQRQYDDTLPTMSVFFKLLRKRWADVCLEAVEFCAQRLLPVGSIRSCRSLQLSDSVSSFVPRRSTVFELRVSHFCSVFVNLSLFNRISSAEITEFLSAIALDKTVLRSFQSSQESFSVAPRVQLALEPQQLSSSSSSSSSSLRFDATDIDATAYSHPIISPDLSALFADFQATLSEQLFESQSNISSKLHKIEQSVRDSLSDQAAVFKSLSQEARQENRTLDDVQTIRFNAFRKKVLEQNASIFVGLADVRKEVQDVNAKVDIMASRLNDIQKDAEATKEALSHQLFEFHSQAQENHSVIHAQLNQQLISWRSAKRRRLDKVERRRWYAQLQFSRYLLEELQQFFVKIQQMLERRRGVHCFVSAEEMFSRLFVEVVQQLLSLFVDDCDTTAFVLVEATAFCLFQQKCSFDISADSYGDFNQQMLYLLNQQMEKRNTPISRRILLSVFPVEVIDNEGEDSADVSNDPIYGTINQKPPPPLLKPHTAAAGERSHRRRRFAGNCSGKSFEENPSVPISSGLLVQADEGVLYPVVDLIDVIYRRLP